MFERIKYLWLYAHHVPWYQVRLVERLLVHATDVEKGHLRSRSGGVGGATAMDARRLYDIYLKESESTVCIRDESSDALVWREIFLLDEYRFVVDLLPCDPRAIVDLGANIGLAALWFSVRYPQASIVSVEAEEENVSLAYSNLRFPISEHRCRVFHAAAWSHDGRVTIERTNRSDWSFSCKESSSESDSDTVDALSLTTVMDRAGLDRVDLLKIDIEGGEEVLLNSGLEKWIGRINAIVCELHGNLDHEWFARRLEPHGMEVTKVSDHLSAAVRNHES